MEKMKNMKIKYLHHSGFSVELEENILVFDYYTEHGKYIEFNPEDYSDKKITIFTSHKHGDHFDTRITTWKNVHYVTSSDITPFNPEKSIFVDPNKTYSYNGLQVKTLKSNDEGVAFLVEVEGVNIYHSGDLNWWDWKGEGVIFCRQIERSFKEQVNQLKGTNIHVAFLPIDPRLEEGAFLCCEYFIENMPPKHIFPMHFWNNFSVCKDAISKFPNNGLQEISYVGQEFDI